jgi:hypothetical protein
LDEVTDLYLIVWLNYFTNMENIETRIVDEIEIVNNSPVLQYYDLYVVNWEYSNA